MGSIAARLKHFGVATAGVLLCTLIAMTGLAPAPARASFGLKAFDVKFTNADGSPDTQAGSHPFAMTTTVELNNHRPESQFEVDGELKDLIIEQIVGLVGTPSATPRCSTSNA